VTEEIRNVLPERLDELVVEITEHELVSDDPAITAAIAALRERGARLAVDDAGAGYAGLTHVMRLKPDVIKLDRALTSGVDGDPVKAALIGSFVGYARDIHAVICAEGIETLEELTRLADLDVAFGQGYFIARPAAPWPAAAPAAEQSCRDTFQASLGDHAEAADRHEHDGLEGLARRLADVATAEDLEHCLPAIARELQSHEVRITPDTARTVHLLTDAAGADPHDVAVLHAAGYRSSLSLPLVHRGATLASLRAYRRTERPWSRFEVGRARLISHQLAAVLQRVGDPAAR
jgi:hypothetical protein